MEANDFSTRPQTRHRRWVRALQFVAVFILGLVCGGLLLSRWMDHSQHSTANNEAQESKASHTKYHCPMHPNIVRDQPGECPICGMRLVPIAGSDISAHDTSQGEAQTDGRATVTIDPARQQLIGLQTALVDSGSIGGQWRTVGRVEVDPTRVRQINVKISGYVEQIFINYVGQPVRRGQALFSLYSPELLSAQQEYLLALKTQAALAKGAATSDGDAVVAAARQKLKLWDVPDSELQRLEQTGEVKKTITFVSPISGVVTAKNVVQGASLAPASIPYEVTDLSVVWMMVDAYETDLERIRVGMRADVVLKSFPNKTFRGEVAFIEPLLDPGSRTLKFHLHLPNPDGELRPEMFGDVILYDKPHDALLIPVDAIVPSGNDNIIFVATGDGKFQPRKVKIGVRDQEHVEILEGVTENERVVLRANFLIDSESSLKAALGHAGHSP